MLHGIDRIDWTALATVYGPASALPDLLRAVASGEPASTEQALPSRMGLALDWG